MENKKVLKISLFALPLAVTLLGGCGEAEREHTHTFVEHAAVAATCSEGGNEMYYTCEGCNKVFDADKKETTLADVQIAKLNHSLTHHDAVPGEDCKHQGTIEYWDCSICNQKFSDAEGKNVITSIVGTIGNHNFVDYQAHAATCTEDGNEAYAQCSVCEKYFAIDHQTEIEEGSWFVGKLGHDWSLEVSGEFKTTYNVGEEFEKDKLVVEKVCKNDSDHNVTLNAEQVELIYQNGSAFALGDTKITVKEVGSELTKEITIAVNKLANTITGLEESYESVCGVGVDLTGVTATSGEVSAKYYLDEVEVAEEDLEGGNTYDVVVSSDGLDSNYEIATATATLVVKHNYVAEPNELVVGYKNEVCTACDDVIVSDELMETEDLDLSMEDASGTPCAYGINAHQFSKDTSEGLYEAGHPGWANDTDSDAEVIMTFPKVNYSLFTNVVYGFNSSVDEWDGSYIGLKLDGKDLLTKENHGKYAKGSITVTYHEENDGYLDVTLHVTNSDFVKTVTIDDPDIIEGVSGLSFVGNFGMYRWFYLSNMMINHTTHEGTGDEIPSKATIGHYVDLCVCGEVAGKGETLMTSSEIDLTNLYGAGVTKTGGDGDPTFKINEKTLVWDNPEHTSPIGLLNLPKIEMTAYKEVKLHMHYACLWGQIGFVEGNTFGGFGDGGKDAKIELTIVQMADESYKATLSCPGKGSMLTTTISDADVLSGAKSLSLYLNFAAYSAITLDSVEVEADYVHEHVYPFVARDVIGTSDISDCTICGKKYDGQADTRVTKAEDIDYSKNLHSATLLSGWGYANDETSRIVYSNELGGAVKYQKTEDYSSGKLTLPRVDYAKYSEVSFPIEAHAYYGLGLNLQDVGSHGWSSGALCYNETLSGFINVKVLDTNLLYVELVNNGEVIDTLTVNSSDIYAGNAGLNFYANIPEGKDYVLIGVPTLVEKLDTSDNLGQIKFIKGGGDWSTDVHVVENGTSLTPGAIRYLGDIAYTNYEISLPLVKYSDYEQVTRQIFFKEASYGVAFTGHPWEDSVISGAKLMTTLKIVRVGEGEYLAKLSDGSNEITTTITDADVLAGTKPFTLVYGAGENGAVYVLPEKASLQHDHMADPIYSSIGGTVTEKCVICGEDMGTRDFADSDLSYSKTLFGCSGSDFSTVEESGKIKVTGTNGYAQASTLALPKVNFNKYSSVEFTLDGYTEYGFSLTGMSWDDGLFKKQQTLTLSFVVGDGTMEVTLSNGDSNQTTTVTDADILSGAKAFNIWSRTGESTDGFTISLPTLIAK